jgi:hypothetical protein
MLDVAGWQKRGLSVLLGRRESLAELLLAAAIFLPFPRTNSTSTFLGNGIKRHASLPSNCWPLPSTKETDILCSRLAACPRSCAVSLRVSHCLESLLTTLSSCFRSSNKHHSLHTLPTRPSKHSQRHREPLDCTCTTPNSHHTTPKLPLLASCSCKFSATSSARPPYTLLLSTPFNPRLLRNSVGLCIHLDLEITAAALNLDSRVNLS